MISLIGERLPRSKQTVDRLVESAARPIRRFAFVLGGSFIAMSLLPPIALVVIEISNGSFDFDLTMTAFVACVGIVGALPAYAFKTILWRDIDDAADLARNAEAHPVTGIGVRNDGGRRTVLVGWKEHGDEKTGYVNIVENLTDSLDAKDLVVLARGGKDAIALVLGPQDMRVGARSSPSIFRRRRSKASTSSGRE